MFDFPPLPDLPASDRAAAPLPLRYEDVTQDGRVRLEAVPPALGPACWWPLLSEHPISSLTRDLGVVPILNRMVIEAGGGPISVYDPLSARGALALGHTRDGQGRVDRIVLQLFADLHGVLGRTYGPAPEGAGERVRVGRVYAEHVFTRPFGAPGERKVLELPEGYGLPRVPERELRWRVPESVQTPPEGARLLDREAQPGRRVRFGLAHTDSNQHVNSLSYVRLFEEAAISRLGEHDRSEPSLGTHLELAYRKPSFAGEELDLSVLAFTLPRGIPRAEGEIEDRRAETGAQTHGAVGSIGPKHGKGRAHCFFRLVAKT
ncbi:MAG: hypothetical protein OEY14_16460 [Myxococcales bacterium]|nr:hypothetical protein [Myxococcales bacterium]